MSRKLRWRLMAAVVAVGTLSTISVFGSEVATVPAKVGRSEAAIRADLQAASGNLRKAMGSASAFSSAESRKQLALKAVEPLTTMVSLLTEMSAAVPEKKGALNGQRTFLLALLGALDNEAAVKQLAAMAGSADKAEAVEGALGQSMGAWIKADGDAGLQGKALDVIDGLAAKDPSSDAIASMLQTMTQMSPAAAGSQKRIDGLYTSTLTGRLAQQIKLQIAASAKLAESIGKPIELAGKTAEGKDFTTKDYAGKVVLIDFWATWCAPCKAELPHVKELYGKYHDKGLEIVGVSCDFDGEALAAFTKDQEMTWVQLWDKATQSKDPSQSMHALAIKLGVAKIPMMLLIDRDGVLRSVKARQELDTLIPKLLDEKAKSK